jgi:transglutaminase-like putative cysteine protease
MNLKKASKAAFVFILLVTTILLQSPLSVKGEPNEKRFTITTTVTYSNHGTTAWNLTGEDYAISLFMNNSWQSVSLIEHSLPLISVRNDTDGNLLGFLNLTQLNPGQNVNYTVKYDVVSKPRLIPNITEEQSQRLADINATLKDEYCKKEGPWLTDNLKLVELASNLTGSEKRVLSIVKNFVRWIADYIDYDWHAEVPKYPTETYSNRTGDCDDQAILLITLCRIVGIPAYLQVGAIHDIFNYGNDTYWQGHVTSVLKQIGWHGWAIVYIPPWGWLPVDLTYVLIDPNLTNPLNAIRGAAVTGQDVIQYMNFTHTDYVGNSRHLRDFIQNNNFYIYMMDEMKMNTDFGNAWELIKLMLRGTLIAAVIIAVSLAAIFVYKWRNSDRI